MLHAAHRCSVIFLGLLAALALTANGDVVLPDPATGNVSGMTGILYWPGRLTSKAGEVAQPLPTAEGCEVHLVSDDDPEQELRYPCGKWFAPPPGRYRSWLEGADAISPTQTFLVAPGTPFRGRGLAAVAPVTAAGRIGVNRTVAAPESVRLFSTHTKFWWTSHAFVFDRRAHSAAPMQMPAGDQVIVGRFDRRTNDAIALARPVTIKAGATQLVWPEEPMASDVLVILRKPPALQLRKPAPSARLTLDGRAADVLVNGGDRIIAVWYGVDARRARIAFQSDAAQWQAREIRLVPGKVATIRDEVKPLPSAKISINAPAGTKLPAGVALEVQSKGATLRKIDAGLGVYELQELPAEALRAILRIGAWEWDEPLDLANGDDGYAAFDLDPLNIRGTVFHGDEPAPAEVTFRNGADRWVAVKTDERGRYETTLWWKDVQTVRVALAGRPPFLDPFREIFESGTYDFHVPRTDYLVRVRDAQSGKAIAGARVSAGNVAGTTLRVAQQVFTDDSGEAVLPPLRDGDLHLGVRAERYETVEQKVIVDSEHHEIDVALRPLHAHASVRVTLATGAAAAGAGVWALDAAMNLIWSGTTSPEGVLEIPERAHDALFVVRHPAAASSVRHGGEPVWRLDPPAEPLALRLDPHAPVALWLDGVRLAGPTLSFAAWSGPAANPDGVWIGRNLPRREAQVATGQYDTSTERIAYPWP